MEWGLTLNANFAKFKRFEIDAQDEYLAILIVLCELGPDFLERRLDVLEPLIAAANDGENPSEKFEPMDFSEYLARLPLERRNKIEARAAEIRLEEAGGK